jgi:hypothetical protein
MIKIKLKSLGKNQGLPDQSGIKHKIFYSLSEGAMVRHFIFMQDSDSHPLNSGTLHTNTFKYKHLAIAACHF